jgi:flagellar protein FlbD
MDNRMIFLTRFDGTEVVVNSDLVVTVEKTPDTVVTLTTGDRIMVKESIHEVVARAAAYRHRVLQGPGVRADAQDIADELDAKAAAGADGVDDGDGRMGA